MAVDWEPEGVHRPPRPGRTHRQPLAAHRRPSLASPARPLVSTVRQFRSTRPSRRATTSAWACRPSSSAMLHSSPKVARRAGRLKTDGLHLGHATLPAVQGKVAGGCLPPCRARLGRWPCAGKPQVAHASLAACRRACSSGQLDFEPGIEHAIRRHDAAAAQGDYAMGHAAQVLKTRVAALAERQVHGF